MTIFLLEKNFWLIAESDLNDPKVVQPNDLGGFGFTAQWLDDFHHALYVLVDQNGQEQYGDFEACDSFKKPIYPGLCIVEIMLQQEKEIWTVVCRYFGRSFHRFYPKP